MFHAVLADAVLVVHGAFIAWVVLGGAAVARWPRLAWAHLPAVAWGVWISATAGICPLTPIEQQLRLAAGQAGYTGGFIEHYLTAAIYPEGLTPGVQRAIAVGVLLWNAAFYTVAWRRAGRTRRAGAWHSAAPPGAPASPPAGTPARTPPEPLRTNQETR